MYRWRCWRVRRSECWTVNRGLARFRRRRRRCRAWLCALQGQKKQLSSKSHPATIEARVGMVVRQPVALGTRLIPNERCLKWQTHPTCDARQKCIMHTS